MNKVLKYKTKDGKTDRGLILLKLEKIKGI